MSSLCKHGHIPLSSDELHHHLPDFFMTSYTYSMTISYWLDERVWTTGRCTNTSLHHLLPIDTEAHWISYTISTRVLSARIMRLELEAYPHFRLALEQVFSVYCWTKTVRCNVRPTTYIFRRKKELKFSSNPFAIRYRREIGGQHHPAVSYP